MRDKKNSKPSPWLLDEEIDTAKIWDRLLSERINNSIVLRFDEPNNFQYIKSIDNNLIIDFRQFLNKCNNSKEYHDAYYYQMVSKLRAPLAKPQTAEKQTIPLNLFIDFCLPPDRAEETRVGLQDVYEKRWLKRYTRPVARSLCCVHALSMMIAYHSSKISKLIAMVLGFLGFKKLTGWFSGTS